MVSVPEKLCQDPEICAKILLYMIMFVFLKFCENTHVMAVCMIASSHYLNQCWLHISEVLCHSPESNFIVSVQPISPYKKFKNYTFTLFTVISPKETQQQNPPAEDKRPEDTSCASLWWYWKRTITQTFPTGVCEFGWKVVRWQFHPSDGGHQGGMGRWAVEELP